MSQCTSGCHFIKIISTNFYTELESVNDLCRFCGNSKETNDPIFIQCPCVNKDGLKLEFFGQRINFNVKEILTNENLKMYTEKFLKTNFKEKKS